MAMVNDENIAPSQATASMSLAVVKLTDAVADLKGLVSRRGSKRPAIAIAEDSRKNGDVQDEVEHIGLASKRAKVETWWRDAASAVSTVRSSVSESAAETVTQVCSKLQTLPDWIRSRTNAAKALFKAAAPREIVQNAHALMRGTRGETEETQSLCGKGDAIAGNIFLINGTTIDDSPPICDKTQEQVEQVIGDTPSEEVITAKDLIAQTFELQDEPSTFGVQSEEAAVPEHHFAEADFERILPNQNIWVVDEEVVQPEDYPHVEQDAIRQETIEAEMMPNDYIDPLAFANEADQAWDVGVAANQAADIDYIVDSQGAEWFPIYDSATRCVYYWNQKTGETTWTQPVTSAEAAFGA